MSQSQQLDALSAALVKAQGEFLPAKFNATNPFLKNRYADLGSVIEASKEVLSRNGLAVSQGVYGVGGEVGVETLLVHSSGQWISTKVSMPIGEEKGKSAAQVAGSIVTYLRRYSLAAILGIYADEDNDGNAPTEKSATKAAAKPAPKAAAPTNGTPDPTNRQEFQTWALGLGLTGDEIANSVKSTGATKFEVNDIPKYMEMCKQALEAKKQP